MSATITLGGDSIKNLGISTLKSIQANFELGSNRGNNAHGKLQVNYTNGKIAEVQKDLERQLGDAEYLAYPAYLDINNECSIESVKLYFWGVDPDYGGCDMRIYSCTFSGIE